jgi:hypothetical protein
MPAAAQSVSVQPRLSGGVQDYELHFDDVILPLPNGGHDFRAGFKVDDRLPFVAGGITVSRGRLFADLSGQWSQNGGSHGEQFENVAIGPGLYTAGDGQNHRSDTRFDRQEQNLTLGWGATPALSLYVGYKHADVNLTQTLAPILTPAPFVDLTGGRDGDVLFTGDYHMKFRYSGAFIGATYAIPVGPGAFALQSSLARLSGTFSQRFQGIVQVTNAGAPAGLRQINPTFKDGEVNGQSYGVNLGVSWSGNLGPLRYTIGVDQSQYKFDSGKSSSIWAADLEEKNTRVRLDLRYRLGDAD